MKMAVLPDPRGLQGVCAWGLRKAVVTEVNRSSHMNLVEDETWAKYEQLGCVRHQGKARWSEALGKRLLPLPRR